MTDLDTRQNSADPEAPYPVADEFQAELSRAKWLVKNRDLDAALTVLLSLKRKFLRGTEILDLLGEVLVQKGLVQEGVRYKTLHELVRMAFTTVPQLSGLVLQPGAQGAVSDITGAGDLAEDAAAVVALEAGGISGPMSEEAPEEALSQFVPLTPAMGNVFMKQGHFDKALQVFRKLLEESPEDESMKAAKELAEKKSREKQLLAIFNRWLKNIESMKTGRFSRI